MEIEMNYSNDTSVSVYDENYFYNLSEIIFKHLQLDDYFIYDINLVSIDMIRQINKEYRNIDCPTDVISFAFEDDVNGANKIIPSSGIPRTLGEIFICVDKCIEQSIEYGHSLDREMGFLFTHGLLHLLGYDHMCEDDEKIMFKLQDEIMGIINL